MRRERLPLPGEPDVPWEPSDKAPLATYTLQVVGPSDSRHEAFGTGLSEQLLRETEENLTDLLPEGFRVVIREWDER
jgi:hypothetical protein